MAAVVGVGRVKIGLLKCDRQPKDKPRRVFCLPKRPPSGRLASRRTGGRPAGQALPARRAISISGDLSRAGLGQTKAPNYHLHLDVCPSDGQVAFSLLEP